MDVAISAGVGARSSRDRSSPMTGDPCLVGMVCARLCSELARLKVKRAAANAERCLARKRPEELVGNRAGLGLTMSGLVTRRLGCSVGSRNGSSCAKGLSQWSTLYRMRLSSMIGRSPMRSDGSRGVPVFPICWSTLGVLSDEADTFSSWLRSSESRRRGLLSSRKASRPKIASATMVPSTPPRIAAFLDTGPWAISSR